MKIEIGGRDEEVELVDDYGDGLDGTLFLVGNEFGWTHLVNAENIGDAEEAWLDEQGTVPEEDLWEDFGFDSKAEYDAAVERGDVTPDLAEGFMYQANFTGTGIVEVGHYHRIIPVKLAKVTLENL